MQLVVNLVAVATACVGAIALRESPLTAVQMLWVNLIMDSLASLSLATETPSDALLDLPPCSQQQSLLSPTVSHAHAIGLPQGCSLCSTNANSCACQTLEVCA